jgi:hypothetical protein
MPITQSRLKNGTLTIGGVAFATQARNVTLSPDVAEQGDSLEVLSGDTILPEETTSWSMGIEAIQDFTDSAGFIAYAMTNAGDTVSFSWAPSGADGPTYTGLVKVRAVEIGGDVAAQLTTSAEWPVQGQPVVSYPTP